LDLCPRTIRGKGGKIAVREHFRSILLQLQLRFGPHSHSHNHVTCVMSENRNPIAFAIDCGCAKFLIMFAVSNWISFLDPQPKHTVESTGRRTPDGHKHGMPLNYFIRIMPYTICANIHIFQPVNVSICAVFFAIHSERFLRVVWPTRQNVKYSMPTI